MPSAGNFVYVQVGDDAAALNEALLRQGVIVRPMGAFGDPTALRITVGTPEENAFFAGALDRRDGRNPLGTAGEFGILAAQAPEGALPAR